MITRQGDGTSTRPNFPSSLHLRRLAPLVAFQAIDAERLPAAKQFSKKAQQLFCSIQDVLLRRCMDLATNYAK